MHNNRIHLSQSHLSGKEEKYIFQSPNWIDVKGENIAGFEADLEQYLKADSYVAALSSGTAALHLALVVLGVQKDDEVICQSMTFSASANPIVYLGASPVFVDSELDTWNMCPIALEEAIVDRISKGKKPKAIIAVHLYGMPYKHDEISTIAQKYAIPLVEDSAEALGSTYKNQKCGTLGDISILSFNGNKVITTSGGGALVTSDVKIKERAIFLATQARETAPHYQHSQIGYNYRMNNICAGIGRGQMEVLTEYVGLRRDMHQLYFDFFQNIDQVKVLHEPTNDYFSNHWLSAILLDSYKKREALRLAFEAENIETRPLWKPMHLQPIFSDAPYYGQQVAENLFNNGLCLPSSSNTTALEKEKILEVMRKFFA
ncbi:pyridoxal phosphate-dependent aminotransferase [Flavobacterium amnicola]|uniref:Pyridoxal phosphate-dependent aminotransferase n=1 Tax=Flavobacterium amnicola TaxID=2506422 RepID=A0A4Q1K0V5_9FLAO|nr:DegT/DnrJ/EryC1/StrS family aminotransferase [Flavobacterium amnicola]RXR17772.1 pyridoxal phosphate-dependent aminotransferase [Flavobacterium amnicola]